MLMVVASVQKNDYEPTVQCCTSYIDSEINFLFAQKSLYSYQNVSNLQFVCLFFSEIRLFSFMFSLSLV